MNLHPMLRVCKDKAKRCAKIAERHAHLGYLTLGMLETHGLIAVACGGCLIFGLLAEVLPDRRART